MTYESQPATTESVGGSMKRTYPQKKKHVEDKGKEQREALSKRREDDVGDHEYR